ncbi:hypothetical protein [Streptomyces sp. NRRL S-237]|uniref:hypothetical protein n=1 Tax=Streptomyces sp. NRRL S-237 TaxID=1463895 RepID=UPI0004C8164D|nr:hypothetical protein [Streptomyces sp. NRRL S-237]
MIEQIWLHPPLAFARLGPSPVPCDNYRWGLSDLSPGGTGKTVVEPRPSLDVAEDGTLTEREPEGDRVRFKDADGFRPLCPFFEVHGAWTADGVRHTGPLTTDVLAAVGMELADVRWEVEVANLKAHHCTLSPGDRIEAGAELAGDDHLRRPLEGRSPQGADRPLVPAGRHVPLGSVQVPRPDDRFPELRLRFTPATGAVYGPTDLPTRSQRFVLPTERLFLSPDAAWCEFTGEGDPRTVPGGLFAGSREEDGEKSLGLVDDVCDGLVTVTLQGGLSARARIVVTPPDFAPDRRPFTSLADGLADRVKRGEVRDPAYIAEHPQLTALEVRDLFERVLEAMDAVNVDAQNERATLENESTAEELGLPTGPARTRTFSPPEPLLGVILALTERGRRRHRRFVALEALEDMFREQPGLIERVIREPGSEDVWYDRRMPVSVRGSDAFPMHLTRRQYDLLVAWVGSLRERVQEGT